MLAPVVSPATLVVLPASADGRDLAPRLAAATARPLVARVTDAAVAPVRSADGVGGPGVTCHAARIDDRVLVRVYVPGPAVVTLTGGVRSGTDAGTGSSSGAGPGSGADGPEPSVVVEELVLPSPDPAVRSAPDPELLELLHPDPRTMDLADATRVLAGGAGLVSGLDDAQATETFALLGSVSTALGGSVGATRVATDAGWIEYDRQIGTTGVTIDPDLYIAFGVSGAAQHIGGLGSPRHVVSVNTDPSCPMTAMADLGLVTDARALLVERAGRLDGQGDRA